MEHGTMIIKAPNNGEQTILSAWRQAVGCTKLDIAHGTGLSSRTVDKILAGIEVSAGSTALVHIYTGIGSRLLKRREKRGTWVIEYDGTTVTVGTEVGS